jgi:hypothetical protein
MYIMQINETEPSIDLMTGKRLFEETKASQVAAGNGNDEDEDEDEDD